MAFLPATFLAESPDVDVYAREPVQANYVASPDPDTQWRTGTQPLDTLPTQWWNYFNNLYTERMNTTNKYLKQVIAEIADCVGAAIDNTDSLQLKQAVTGKIDALKQQVDALEDRVDDLDVTTTTPNSVTTSTNSAGSSTHAARADHTHAIADSAVTRAKIAASTITADRLARVTPGSASTTAVAIAQAYNAALATKLANAGLVSVQTSIPSSATNEAAYCVPNVAAVRSFVSSHRFYGVATALVVDGTSYTYALSGGAPIEFIQLTHSKSYSLWYLYVRNNRSDTISVFNLSGSTPWQWVIGPGELRTGDITAPSTQFVVMHLS